MPLTSSLSDYTAWQCYTAWITEVMTLFETYKWEILEHSFILRTLIPVTLIFSPNMRGVGLWGSRGASSSWGQTDDGVWLLLLSNQKGRLAETPDICYKPQGILLGRVMIIVEHLSKLLRRYSLVLINWMIHLILILLFLCILHIDLTIITGTKIEKKKREQDAKCKMQNAEFSIVRWVNSQV